MRSYAGTCAIVGAILGGVAPGPATGSEAPSRSSCPPVEVVATVPLPGLATPLSEVPANLQVFDAREIGRSGASSVCRVPRTRGDERQHNAASGNPFQPDISFRGFTASPLLGTPTGVSVFLDGVRVNEVFGDVVNWDLIPVNAIASLQVMPGSNPVYGLNTLGGAFAIYTKDGLRYPGAAAEVSGGSYGRRSATAELGGSGGALDGYLTAHAYDEDGWRDHSSSRIRQAFGKGAWRSGRDEVGATLLVADNELNGTQALPVSMLDAPRQAYTWPDTTHNELAAVTLFGRRGLGGGDSVVVNAYARKLRSSGVNSNVNPDAAADDAPQAFNLTSDTHTRSAGASAQWTSTHTLGVTRHRVTAGIAADWGTTDFTQASEDAMFTPDRETVSIGAPATTVDASTRTTQLGVYAQDVVALSERLSGTLSARYQTARIAIDDNTGTAPGLAGTHTYERLNAAAGATYQLARSSTIYGNVSQGMRVPTAAELTCADPAAPCSLPNIFVADPPLKAVIATTLEAGARGRWTVSGDGRGTWSAALFRTSLADDIQFIATGTGAVNTGYFSNAGRTKRTGIELAGSLPVGPFHLAARYSHIRAVFATDFAEHSPNNASADATGTIVVHSGDRIPGIPADLLKLRARLRPAPDGTLPQRWSPRATSTHAATRTTATLRGACPAMPCSISTPRGDLRRAGRSKRRWATCSIGAIRR